MADFFEFPIRVYYEDTDAGGVVFYANYLRFFERARTEWLRHSGVSQHHMMQQFGAMFVVKAVEIDYRLPARLDDLLRIRSSVLKLGRVAVIFQQQAWRDGASAPELLSRSEIKVGCVSCQTLRPIEIPPAVHSAFLP